jgi:hypothetical protein
VADAACARTWEDVEDSIDRSNHTQLVITRIADGIRHTTRAHRRAPCPTAGLGVAANRVVVYLADRELQGERVGESSPQDETP